MIILTSYEYFRLSICEYFALNDSSHIIRIFSSQYMRIFRFGAGVHPISVIQKIKILEYDGAIDEDFWHGPPTGLSQKSSIFVIQKIKILECDDA